MPDFVTLFFLRDHSTSENPFRHDPPANSFLWKETATAKTWALWPNVDIDNVLIHDEMKESDPDFLDRFPWKMEFVERKHDLNGEIWKRGALKD